MDKWYNWAGAAMPIIWVLGQWVWIELTHRIRMRKLSKQHEQWLEQMARGDHRDRLLEDLRKLEFSKR